jgi:hypothetical protein
VERLMPPGGGIPPSEQARPAVIAVGPFRMDNSHPEYTTVPYEATRSGLQAALQERATQVQACVDASAMEVDAPVTYIAKIWPDMPWHDVMEVVASKEAFDQMTDDERARTRDFDHCVHWALTSAEFARTPDDEFVEVELPLPGPRLTPAHQVAAPKPSAWVEEAGQNWRHALEEASKKK